MPKPTEIKLHSRSRILELTFDDGVHAELSCEYLRVYSPSAEVRGHGPDDAVLQVGKEDVLITAIDPVGQYAVRLIFNDGHETGLYSWDYLYELSTEYTAKWQNYLGRLSAAGHQRKA